METVSLFSLCLILSFVGLSYPRYVSFTDQLAKKRSSHHRHVREAPDIDTPPCVCSDLNEIDATRGTLKSPLMLINGTLEVYHQHCNCTWVIRHPGKNIMIASREFSLEQSEQCVWDYLEIREGEDATGNLVGKFCGYKPVSFASQSDMLYLRFVSDESFEDFGFKIDYVATAPSNGRVQACNTTTTTPGRIDSMFGGGIDEFTSCFYRIKAPIGKSVELQITSINLAEEPCPLERVDTYDGNTTLAPKTVYCGSSIPAVIHSTEQDLYIHFHSTGNTGANVGFTAEYSFVPDTFDWPEVTEAPLKPAIEYGGNRDCSEIINVTGDGGVVTSPSYPDAYPNNKHCVVVIRAPTDFEKVSLTITEFDLEDVEGCVFDSLEIFYENVGSRSSGKLCGLGSELTHKVFISDADSLRLEFHSDDSFGLFGYKAVYSIHIVEACGDPCDSGTVCVRAVDGFYICEDGSICPSSTCQNGGTCLVNGGEETCYCAEEFTGGECADRTPVGGSVEFTARPESQDVIRGAGVTLECQVKGDDVGYTWTFRPSGDDDVRIIDEESGEAATAHPGGVLQVRPFQEEHGGSYTCIAIGDDIYGEASATLTLVEDCELRVVIFPKNKAMKEGESVMFKCSVPAASQITWLKDGEPVFEDGRFEVLVNNYLQITNVESEDAGEYTCRAVSNFGCAIKKKAKLTVVPHSRYRSECGRTSIHRDEGIAGKIVSGKEAQQGSAPWHATLFVNVENRVYCGGSLISNRWIVTAAHCFSGFERTFRREFRKAETTIYLGTNDCRGGSAGFSASIKNIIIHPSYEQNGRFDNDIALVELNEYVTYTDLIKPICLESDEFLDDVFFRGSGTKLGRVIGCGQLSEWEGSPAKLNEVYVPYVSREQCKRQAPNAVTFTDTMICAGYNREMKGDACGGDSGGSYAIELKEGSGRHATVRWVLGGIVSFGKGCDREGEYGYYANSGKFYRWIKTQSGLNTD